MSWVVLVLLSHPADVEQGRGFLRLGFCNLIDIGHRRDRLKPAALYLLQVRTVCINKTNSSNLYPPMKDSFREKSKSQT